MKVTIKLLSSESYTGYEYYIAEFPVEISVESETGLSIKQLENSYVLTEASKEETEEGRFYYSYEE